MAATRKLHEEIAAVLAGEAAMAKILSRAPEDSTVYAEAKGRVTALRMVTFSIADKLVQDNPRFDRQKFYDAVGLGQ